MVCNNVAITGTFTSVTEAPVDVPEPPVMLLSLLGAAGLWLRRRLQSRA